jgi:hypothetical protein
MWQDKSSKKPVGKPKKTKTKSPLSGRKKTIKIQKKK